MNSFFQRRYVIAGVFITLIIILLARLFYMQVIDDRYLQFANRNVIRQFMQYPARGPIYDRNKKILVQNKLVYDVSVIPRQVKPFDTVEFCRLLDITKEDFDKRFTKAIKYSRALPSKFGKQLSPELYASLQERMSEFPGFFVEPHPVRIYPDSTAAQFLGYIGEVTDTKIKESGGYYRPGDYIGITGVERAYENILRGQRGVKNVMVDSRGVPQGSYANGAFDTVETPGEKVVSSLDIRIQKLGEKLMQNKIGSIVAIEPATGEVLCFVSSPTYDPNLMVAGPDRGKNYKKLTTDPYKPFLIRPIMANYSPGSSFKPLSALVALQEGIIDQNTTYTCTGSYLPNRGKPKCTHVHGVVNLSSAIAQSCNGYFAMVFERLINKAGAKATAASFTDWRSRVTAFGLAQRLNIDMAGENKGQLFKAEQYDKRYGVGRWRSKTVISLSIGQGEVESTPLQLANIECIIANQGFYYLPHLVKSIGNNPVIKHEYTVRHEVGVKPQYFAQVIDGMQNVVEYGTARGSRIPGINMVGKTGTVQNNRGANHSVFVAYAPRENPKIAIAVVVENSGDGGRWAAPIASFIVEKYLRDTISRRPSGITLDYFMNANLLAQPKPKPKVTVTDSTKLQPTVITPVKTAAAGIANKNISANAIIKRKDDE
ncbi:penicillin-binding protein 2 [Mucilaginibacter auburnensis]|uniref:Penicillin-binding protein 2 n=1 Tax=Mucilaginibacter auburnensis TaxID=1457233 RepID=A0A2H9VNG3_9SPHI|nr:penicillin-binding protein 2 [Mucilaginibacter auburnensis]PJJ79869.1 penicillin-binding protein 2 [Mucilaginibacter auburnensis]